MLKSPHRLLWIGLFALDGAEVPTAPQPGGVVLFARNLDPEPGTGPARCHGLLRDLQARWGVEAPLAVALDQEGGAVSRLRTWVGPTPSLRRIWKRGGPEACQLWGDLWGRGLALLGFNVDFAPVADLWAEAAAMGDRCASQDPLSAARAAGAFLAGLESAGVRGCLKHFPGLGGTTLDSHLGLPEQLEPPLIQRNVLPFQVLAHPDRLVMVAHLKLPATEGLPASLSPLGVAQNPWGVTARWLPDDLEMGGAADWSWDDRVRLCLQAGHQALLVCQTPAAVAACARAAEALPETLWRPAAQAFATLRQALPAPAPAFRPEAWGAWLAETRDHAAAFLA